MIHCVKIVQIRSFFWSPFSRIRTEYGEILKSEFEKMQTRKNSVFGQFSRDSVSDGVFFRFFSDWDFLKFFSYKVLFVVLSDKLLKRFLSCVSSPLFPVCYCFFIKSC